MKLYELKRNDKFKINEKNVDVPPAAPTADHSVVYSYTHVDGMYAPCQGSDGERYYFAAWTDVEKV